MDSTSQRPKLVVIVGPTASGKSDLAMRVAKNFDGEIISADSLTIYKNMDIGTAKPTKEDQAKVKHWGIDITGPGQRFTAAQFKDYAQQQIKAIQARGHLSVVVGGTGLYIDSLVFDFSFIGDADPRLRQELERLSVHELQQIIKKKSYTMPSNSQNRRHLISIIERQGEKGDRLSKPRKGVVLVGLRPEREVHREKIGSRVEEMFASALVAETKELIKTYGAESMKTKAAVAYGPVIDYCQGKISLDEAKERLKMAHWQYARRQRTWFKRNRYINWFSNADEAYKFIKKQLVNT